MKVTASPPDDMRPEYDFSGGVRGKFYKEYMKGTNVVLLDPDVAEVFPDSRAVNEALPVARAGIQLKPESAIQPRRRLGFVNEVHVEREPSERLLQGLLTPASSACTRARPTRIRTPNRRPFRNCSAQRTAA